MNRFRKGKALVAGMLLSITLTSTTAFAADYTVLQSDSLYKISRLFNTTVNTLKAKNNLTTDVIYPGQKLDISAEIYIVQKGDTLFLIAQRYGISLSSLRQANNKWDNLLIPGQKLILPELKDATTYVKPTTTSKTVIPYTNEEVDLLARLITAEATGEPYEAMVAVGAVVVNRVQSTDWPSTINSVINHVAGGYHQFTPVKNGYINIAPSDDAIRAAWAALYGSDPSNGAYFYFDDSSKNEWLWSKKVTARIGSMVYVY